jgi:hypothetical protein
MVILPTVLFGVLSERGVFETEMRRRNPMDCSEGM